MGRPDRRNPANHHHEVGAGLVDGDCPTDTAARPTGAAPEWGARVRTLTVSVPVPVQVARIQYVGPMRLDGRHLVVFLDTDGAVRSGVAEAHDVRAYYEAIALGDAQAMQEAE